MRRPGAAVSLNNTQQVAPDLPRRAPPAPSPALLEVRRVYDAVRELDVERLPPHERRSALKLIDGMRSLAAWYGKRVLERLHWEGSE